MNNELLEKAERAYRMGEPFISDFDFDRLSGNDSGKGTFFSEENMIVHQRPLLSLRHTYDFEEVFRWVKWLHYQFRFKPIITLEPKIDGIALSIVYDERGRFFSAATKHRGQNEGYDVTEKIKAARCVPEYGPEGEQITGEFVLIGESFPSEYKTRRSCACAYLQSKSNELAKERFAFYPHGLSSSNEYYIEKKERLCKLYGFREFPNVRTVEEDLEITFKTFEVMRPFWPFEADGIVLRVDHLEDFYSLGNNERYPLGAIAYKWREYDFGQKIKELDKFKVKA